MAEEDDGPLAFTGPQPPEAHAWLKTINEKLSAGVAADLDQTMGEFIRNGHVVLIEGAPPVKFVGWVDPERKTITSTRTLFAPADVIVFRGGDTEPMKLPRVDLDTAQPNYDEVAAEAERFRSEMLNGPDPIHNAIRKT